MSVTADEALDSITSFCDADYDDELGGWWSASVEEDSDGKAFGKLTFDDNDGFTLVFEIRQVDE